MTTKYPEDLIINDQKLRGEGSHCRVFEGSFFQTPVAVKQYKKVATDSFKRELNFYRRVQQLQLHHPGLLCYMGAFQRTVVDSGREQTRYCLITELAPYGNLAQVLWGKQSPNLSSEMTFLDKLQIAI